MLSTESIRVLYPVSNVDMHLGSTCIGKSVQPSRDTVYENAGSQSVLGIGRSSRVELERSRIIEKGLALINAVDRDALSG